MASIRSRVLTEIAARLNASRPAGVPVFGLYSIRSVNAGNMPFAVIYPSAEDVEPASNRAGPLSMRSMNVVIEIRSAADDPFTEIDASLVWITSILGGVRLSVAGISQLTHEILETKTQWRVANGKDQDYVAAFVQIEVPYNTAVRNQETIS